MLVLGINTVCDVCDAALFGAEAEAHVRSEPMIQGHDARLAPIVQGLMKEASRTMSEIDRIAVIVGPGSFTGVRVGVAFARGLALALGRPAVGVTSLEVLAVHAGRGRVLAVLPARRRPPELSWWAQVIVDGRGVGEPVEADAARLAQMSADVDVVVGEALDTLSSGAPKRLESPSAISAALWAYRLAGDLPAARPVYVREPDATPMVRL